MLHPRSILFVYEFLLSFCYLNDNVGNSLHRLDANKLIDAVEIHTAGAEIGARQTAERKCRTVGTAANGPQRRIAS